MSSIQLSLNGEVVTIDNPDPSVTLNDYIRHHTKYTGTKLGCGEGGCGACAVIVSSVDASGKETHRSLNSCLRPLVACDGLAITTTEGLGTEATGHHPVQKRIADFNGSQCGFCTPGMVMSTYAALMRVADESKGGDADPKSLALLMEEGFDGNICRCTGYRPILEAARSLVDESIQDQVGQGCSTGARKPAETGAVAAKAPAIPAALATDASSTAKEFHGPTLHWHRPTTIEDALKLAETHGDNARFAVANTSVGIYKDEPTTVLIDLGSIESLKVLEQGESSLVVGAAVSIANLINALRARASSKFADGSVQRASSDALIRHCDRIANHHVRNAGTVGGNLVLTAKHGFESDLATILCGYGASVSIVSKSGSSKLSLLDFLQKTAADVQQVVVQSVEIPDPGASTVFRSFKVGLRQLNSHALVNAAFKADVGPDKVLSNVSAVYGAVHPDHPINVAAVAAALNGNKLDADVVAAAVAAAADNAVVPPESPRATYRQHLVSVFLSKYLEVLSGDNSAASKLSPLERRFDADGLEPRDLVQTRRMIVARTDKNTNGGSGSRHIQDVNSTAEEQAQNQPVNAPIPKFSARIQASGEARYTDDEPLPGNSLFAAFATSPVANQKLVGVDGAAALAAPGVVRVITFKDIPGQNNIGGWWQEELLASDTVMYAGQPIAIVVADSLRHAQDAAKLVKGNFDKIGEPVLTNQQSRAKSMEFKGLSNHHVRSSGKSIDEALEAAPLKLLNVNIRSKSQQHFYMEPQCAWANPDEGGRIRVGSSMQWPNGTQAQVSKVLGITRNRVRVTNRRSGGGFGGKLTRHLPSAAGAALAAHLVGRPVRMTQPRNVDMMMTGGRHATDTTYSVGYDKDGNLLAVKIDTMMNGGYATDASAFCVMSLARAADQVYYVPDWEIKCQGMRTNLSIKTAMRGPGEIQASYIMESIMNSVVQDLWERNGYKEPLASLSHRLRIQNTYPEDDEEKLVTPNGDKIQWFTMPQLWRKCAENADFEKRAKKIEEFNATHKLLKRGLAMTPVKYGVAARYQQAYLTVYEDGTIQLNHGGSDVGQGIHTKVIQAATHALRQFAVTGVDMSLFVCEETNTSVIPNAAMTGGSTTSEAACAAIMNAVGQLIERLEPVRAACVKDKLKKLEEERQKAAGSGGGSAKDGDAAKTAASGGGAAEEKKTGADDEADIPPISWLEVVSKALANNIPLAIQSTFRRMPGAISSAEDVQPVKYFNFGACASEVEVDVRTGEVMILRSDMVYDCGTSLNPAIDIGQAEGGFVQGLGFYLTEDLLQDEEGRVESDGTWEYKPPLMVDIPLRFNVEFMRGIDKGKGILSSKASGEPPLVLATSVYSAIVQAVGAARKDAGLPARCDFNAPITVEKVALACKQ